MIVPVLTIAICYVALVGSCSSSACCTAQSDPMVHNLVEAGEMVAVDALAHVATPLFVLGLVLALAAVHLH